MTIEKVFLGMSLIVVLFFAVIIYCALVTAGKGDDKMDEIFKRRSQ
jgi:hypothetical protein